MATAPLAKSGTAHTLGDSTWRRCQRSWCHCMAARLGAVGDALLAVRREEVGPPAARVATVSWKAPQLTA